MARVERPCSGTGQAPVLDRLGHLLDVALSRPQDAVAHLQRAFRTQPSQEEVGASYARTNRDTMSDPLGG